MRDYTVGACCQAMEQELLTEYDSETMEAVFISHT